VEKFTPDGLGSVFAHVPCLFIAIAPTVRPFIISSPPNQSAEAGATVRLGVYAVGTSPDYCWYFNQTNLLSCGTNRVVEFTNVQFAQSGIYTVVISNVLGAVTSAPAMLQVNAPVERRSVPGIRLTGPLGSILNVDYTQSLGLPPAWTNLDSVTLSSPSQHYFDLTLPLPPHRFYRAGKAVGPGAISVLDLHMVAAITLTGNIGDSLRLDYINRVGPTDAWVTLDTVTLTNTSQLYFDVSGLGQPERLYRLVHIP
jgi:hypothetical protein